MLLTFTEFAKIVSELNNERRPSISEGIAINGPRYNAAADEEIDSLSLAEMFMGLEEGLLGHFGQDFQISDEVSDAAEDMGHLYRLICNSVGIEGVMDWKKAA